jgi:hypothetical protein
MNRTGVVGIVLIPVGLLVLWGGISGNLAAILAAIFVPSALVPTSAGGGGIPSVSFAGFTSGETPIPLLEPTPSTIDSWLHDLGF